MRRRVCSWGGVRGEVDRDAVEVQFPHEGGSELLQSWIVAGPGAGEEDVGLGHEGLRRQGAGQGRGGAAAIGGRRDGSYRLPLRPVGEEEQGALKRVRERDGVGPSARDAL